MASVKYAFPIDEVRGSIGGTTFTRSRAGSIARIRNTPRRPISSLLATSKPYLTDAVWSWHAVLSQVQRDAWNDLGDATDWTNSLEQIYHPSGHNLYVRAFIVARWANYDPTSFPPSVAADPDPGFTMVYDGARYFQITDYGTLSSPPAGRRLLWQSPQLPPASHTFNHPWTWRLRIGISALPALPWRFYDLTPTHPDTRMFFRFRVYRHWSTPPPLTEGRCSHPFIHDVFADAGP